MIILQIIMNKVINMIKIAIKLIVDYISYKFYLILIKVAKILTNVRRANMPATYVQLALML